MFGALRKKRASQQQQQAEVAAQEHATHASTSSDTPQYANVTAQDQATLDMIRSKAHSRHPHSKDGDDFTAQHGDGQDLGEGFDDEQDLQEEQEDDSDEDLFKFMPPSQTTPPIVSPGQPTSSNTAAAGPLLPAHSVTAQQSHPLQTATTVTSANTEDIAALAYAPGEQRNNNTAQSRPMTAVRSSWDHGAPLKLEGKISSKAENMTDAQKVALDYQSSKHSLSSKRSDSPEDCQNVQFHTSDEPERAATQKRRQPYQYPGSPVYTTAPKYPQVGGNSTARQNNATSELADRERQSSSMTASYPPEYDLDPEDPYNISANGNNQYTQHYVDVSKARAGAHIPQTPQTVRHRMSKTYSEHDESKRSIGNRASASWTTPESPASKSDFPYMSDDYGFDRMRLDSKIGIDIASRDGVLKYPTSGRYATEDGMDSTAVGSTPGLDGMKDSFQPFELEDEEDSPYPEVRASVSNIDDPEMPCLTFRALYIGLSSVIVCSIVQYFNGIRFPFPYFTPLTAQILTYPFGKLLAYILPTKTFKTPRFLTFVGAPSEWSLNPGPFNIKEHTVIVIMSNMGLNSSYALAFSLTLDKFYGTPKGLTFDWLCCISTYVIGFSFAGLCRRYLVWPASLIWPQNLVICDVFNTFHAEDDDGSDGSLTRFRYLSYVISGAAVWYILPGFLFKALSVFSFVCWMAPRAKIVNQLFGIVTGLGMSGLTFDWSQIAYIGSPLICPWWAACNIFVGFALLYWFIVPILYYTNTWNFAYMPISAGGNFDRWGQPYNISRVISPDISLSDEGYKEYSMLFMSTTFATVYALSFTLATAAIVHTLIYNGKEIYLRYKNAHTEMEDVHAKLMRNYPEVPDWWYWAIFVVSTTIGIAVIEIYETQLPVWLFLISIVLGAAYVLPGGYIFAVTSQVITVNLIAETIPGYALPGKPIANMLFKIYSIQTLNSALLFVQDLKLGHYMKIPPRITFGVQVLAILVSSGTQMGVKKAILAFVPDLCSPDQKSLLVCPLSSVLFEASVIWGAIGPDRFFGRNSIYHPLLYFTILGALLPIPFYLFSRRYPGSWVKYINIPVLLNGASYIPPGTGINYSSWFLVGFIFQYVLRRFRFRWWSKFCFVTSAGMESGTIFAAFFIFLTLQLPKAGDLQPDWWGNNVYKKTADWEGISLKQDDRQGNPSL